MCACAHMHTRITPRARPPIAMPPTNPSPKPHPCIPASLHPWRVQRGAGDVWRFHSTSYFTYLTSLRAPYYGEPLDVAPFRLLLCLALALLTGITSTLMVFVLGALKLPMVILTCVCTRLWGGGRGAGCGVHAVREAGGGKAGGGGRACGEADMAHGTRQRPDDQARAALWDWPRR